MENNIDLIMKQYLEKEMLKRELLSLESCPSELELSDYLDNKLDAEKEDSLLEHLDSCSRCLSLLELAKSPEESQEEPPLNMIDRAKNIVRKESKKSMLHYKWQFLALTAFILSFILTKYFLQFLALALIFSIKWIFDTGSTRTLIMIYEAWKKKDQGTAQRIIQDFQPLLGPRK